MGNFKVTSTSPDAYIAFFPYTNRNTQMATDFKGSDLDTKPIFVRTDILSITTTKPKGGKGHWNATLAPGLNYPSIIQTGCWCMIFMSNEDLTLTEQADFNTGKNSGIKMLGIVRSIRTIEASDPTTNTRQVKYELAGDDFHSAFDSQTFINPDLRISQQDDFAANSYYYFKNLDRGSYNPAEFVELLVDLFLGKYEGLGKGILSASGFKSGGVLGIPPQVSRRILGAPAEGNLFINLLETYYPPNLIGKMINQPTTGSLFSLWSMVQSYTNGIVNESYTDLFPDSTGRIGPALVLRPIPFTSKGFKNNYQGTQLNAPVLKISNVVGKKSDPVTQFYTSKFIEEGDIFAMNYGKSDAERFNFFFISNNYVQDASVKSNQMGALLKGADSSNLGNPLGDAASVARHGLRPYMGASTYGLQGDIGGVNSPIIAMNVVARDLWHEAYRFDNGQVQIIGSKEHIPVGTNIEFVDRKWIAHVESVSHSYQVSPMGQKSFRTNISFVRLQTTGGIPIDEAINAGERKDYQPGITQSEPPQKKTDGSDS